MPLREDLLAPIPGANPSGKDLYYEQVYVDIREAQREEDDTLPEGVWVPKGKKKKADYKAVIKLAGEALAKQSKDLQLAGWLAESLLRVEGFPVIAPSIELLRSIQESFWPTLYPPIEEDGNLESRKLAVESAGKLIAAALRKLPLTKSGRNLDDYLQSRAVGSEKDATDNDRKKKRAEAIEANQLTVEVFDEECAASPKSLFVDAESALAESLLALTRLDQYHRETYGEEDKAPSLVDLQKGLEEIHEVVEFLLNERRKTEPDPAPVVEESPQEEEHQESDGRKEELEPMGKEPKRRVSASGPLRQISDAYALVVESAEYLFDRDPKSPVPYLVCASLRLGETRMQGPTPSPGFAVGPSSETRQSLRNLATKGSWNELMRASLPILASECARGWLDLHRYVWRAGQETGANAISTAVVGTLKSLLTTQSEIRYWTLEDDTGAANPETQHWLDTVVFGGARSEISGPGAS